VSKARFFHLWLIVAIGFSLTACFAYSPRRYAIRQDHAPRIEQDVSHVRDAVPRHEPLSRYGNPASYIVMRRRFHVLKTARGYHSQGLASWYGMKFHGHLTSSREPYDIMKMTAAHRTLPIPTYVQVTHLKNGRRVIVKVNDRGPFVGNRLIDLSYAAAKKLDILRTGTAWVDVRVVTPKTQIKTAKSITPPITKQVTSEKFWLQLGAFSRPQNAVQFTIRLKQTVNIPMIIQPTQSEQRNWHRVLAGPFYTHRERQHAHQQLKAAGFQPSLLKK